MLFGSVLHPVLAWHILCNMPGTPLSAEELRLAKVWYHDDEEDPAEIARRLRRVKSTITRAVVQELARGGRGRKPTLSGSSESSRPELSEVCIPDEERWPSFGGDTFVRTTNLKSVEYDGLPGLLLQVPAPAGRRAVLLPSCPRAFSSPCSPTSSEM